MVLSWPFVRYGDLLAKNCLFLLHFCYPSLIRRTRSLCSSENRMIVAGVVWQTDGQTESFMANTALCIASYMLTRCKNTQIKCLLLLVQLTLHFCLQIESFLSAGAIPVPALGSRENRYKADFDTFDSLKPAHWPRHGYRINIHLVNRPTAGLCSAVSRICSSGSSGNMMISGSDCVTSKSRLI